MVNHTCLILMNKVLNMSQHGLVKDAGPPNGEAAKPVMLLLSYQTLGPLSVGYLVDAAMVTSCEYSNG